MSRVVATATLVNGLRNEFADTYTAFDRRSDERLSVFMDMSIGAMSRQELFAYFLAAPHMTNWKRGDTIPTDAMDSVGFEVPIYEWARRIPWSKWDRKDDKTQSLMEAAQMVGKSAAMLPERFAFDLLTGSTNTLPGIPLAPDGVNMFSTTDGNGDDRFGVSDGNLLTGSGVASSAAILSDYYSGCEQHALMQDGKGQPMLTPDIIDAGYLVIFGVQNKQVFEEAFLQRRRGVVLGTDAGTTPSNIVQDASRDVQLMGTSRITDNSWYQILLSPPKKPTFLLEREALQDFSSLEGDNNGDHTRTTAEEYVQWEWRAGAGVALPYAAIKHSN